MNTTALISNWSMAGAKQDLERRFAPSADILAAVADGGSEPSGDTTPPDPPPSNVMVKRAGADDWQPLAGDA